jgi:hypothetical protein
MTLAVGQRGGNSFRCHRANVIENRQALPLGGQKELHFAEYVQQKVIDLT